MTFDFRSSISDAKVSSSSSFLSSFDTHSFMFDLFGRTLHVQVLHNLGSDSFPCSGRKAQEWLFCKPSHIAHFAVSCPEWCDTQTPKEVSVSLVGGMS